VYNSIDILFIKIYSERYRVEERNNSQLDALLQAGWFEHMPPLGLADFRRRNGHGVKLS
jgi:hypothetical protein